MKYNHLSRKGKSYDEFLKSPYFSSFILLQVAIDRGAIRDPKDYIIYLSKKRIPTNKWADEVIIKAYKTNHAIEASGVQHVVDSMTNVNNYCLIKDITLDVFFEQAPTKDIIEMIESGKLHPWFLLTSDKQDLFYQRISDEAYRHLMRTINLSYWEDRISRDDATLNEILKLYDDIDYT